MPNEGFLSRWSRRKVESQNNQATPPAVAKEDADKPVPPDSGRAPQALPADDAAQPPLPLTMEDVARLTKDSDYSAFLARGVDENVKRSALKKLFSDPHFNVMDGLDVYIDDYSKFEPIPAAMLATLNHAKSLLDPLSQLEKPVMSLVDDKLEPEKARTEDGEPAGGDPELAVTETPDAPEAANAEPAPGQQQYPAPDTSADPAKLSQERP
jgi:hypothetical protein